MNVTTWAETVINAISAEVSGGLPNAQVPHADVFSRLGAVVVDGELSSAVSRMLNLLHDGGLVEAGHAADGGLVYWLNSSGQLASRRGVKVALDTDAVRAQLSKPCVRFANRFAFILCDGTEKQDYALPLDRQVTDNDVFDELEADGDLKLGARERARFLDEAIRAKLVRRDSEALAGVVLRARLPLFPVAGH